MQFEKDYYKCAFSVDNVIFGFDGSNIKVLLIKRNVDPFIGYWALPGDTIDANEELKDAALRVLDRLTGLTDVYLEQVKSFSEVNRHPRERVITVTYYSLINITNAEIKPDYFAEKAEWREVDDIDSLAFDHYHIIQTCLDKLKTSIKLRPIGFELLPTKFTLTQLQNLYEAILEQDLDKRNFRKKILSMNILKTLHELQSDVPHRPAKLYSFDAEKYAAAQESGFIFEL